MPRVYLVCQPTVKKNGKLPDLSALEQHGEIVVAIPQGMKPSRVPDTAVRFLRKALETFDPARDFLAWAGGDTLAAMLVGAVLREREVAQFTYLRYERVRLAGGEWTDEGATYHPVLVTL